jgi:hypothetical protein
MLKGQAKTDYQREYMRRRRAAAPQREPKPIRKAAPKRMIEQIKYWGRHAGSANLSSVGRAVIDGLDLGTDQGMAEACRRYKVHLDQRRTAKEAQAKREADAKTATKRYSFCGEPASKDRIMVGGSNGWSFICDSCVGEADAIIAAQRAARS